MFEIPVITDDGGNNNYPSYWASTTRDDGPMPNKAVYVCFGEALGFMESPPNSGNYELQDVHGADAQRSDPKAGNPDDYPYGLGPQGEVICIYNYVRCVRGGTVTSVGSNIDNLDGIPLEFTLEQNFPNPFNPPTQMQYYLPLTEPVR